MANAAGDERDDPEVVIRVALPAPEFGYPLMCFAFTYQGHIRGHETQKVGPSCRHRHGSSRADVAVLGCVTDGCSGEEQPFA